MSDARLEEEPIDDVGEPMDVLVQHVPLLEAPAALVAFVNGPLQDRFTGAGKKDTKRWCIRWTEHPDAVHRLAAIYDEYQFMLIGGKGAPSLHMFIREVIDYHMPFLVDPSSGVFAECGHYGHADHTRVDAAAAKKSA
ncbi:MULTISPECIES: DUF4913 domain-containing protein [Bacteria]|uniref:DUF4913 domain-containing protein n=1 Tax=Bacteria TaxID=2 RepID=UPI003C7D8C11